MSFLANIRARNKQKTDSIEEDSTISYSGSESSSSETREDSFRYAGVSSRFVLKRRKYDLKWKEFMIFMCMTQMPLNFWIRQARVVKKWGATMVIFVNTFVGMVLAMPVFMIYMFMGNYSRKSYIKFWACVPILKGLAYSIALRGIFLHTFDLSISGMAVMYLKELFAEDIPWNKCQFDNAHHDCLSALIIRESYTTTCCSEFMKNCSFAKQLSSSAKFAALDYYWSHMLGMNYDLTPRHDNLNWFWILSMAFLWMLIYILMLMGLRRIRGIMTGINRAIFILLIPASLFTMFMSPSYAAITDIHSNYRNIFNYEFWVDTVMATFHMEQPGDVLTFSALSSPGLTTTVDTVTIYLMKISFFTMLTVWISIGVTLIQESYSIADSRCIPIEGDILIFAILPDILSRWIMGQFWLIIYFLIILFWGFSTTIYVFNSFLEALLQEFPNLRKWKIFFCGVFCLTVGFMNSSSLKPEFMVIFRYLLEITFAQIKAVVILLSMLGLFIYTVGKVKADYHFTYGVFLPSFWTQTVKIGIMFISGICLTSLIYKWKDDRYKYMVYIILIPPPVGVIIMTILYYKKKIKTLLEPDPSWGAPSFKVRQARARFDPTYNIRNKGMIDTCRHACLKGLSTVKAEVTHWQLEKDRYERLYEMSNKPSPFKKKPETTQK